MLDGPALFKLSRGRPKELLPQIEPQECGLLAFLSSPVGQLRLLVVQMKIPLIPAFPFRTEIPSRTSTADFGALQSCKRI